MTASTIRIQIILVLSLFVYESLAESYEIPKDSVLLAAVKKRKKVNKKSYDRSAVKGEDADAKPLVEEVSTKKKKSAPPKKTRSASSEEAVDLSNLDASTGSTSESYNRLRGQTGGGGAKFRTYFDLIFSYRPGDQPLGFENFHTVFLVEYTPLPTLMFTLGVAPPTVVPRYYEVDWQLNDRLTLRLGRIWIPFDQINPHNTFGGFINASLMRAANQEAFLPDVWTDLGIAAKYQLLTGGKLELESHLYVVNGFGEGGTDPLAESGTYPSFSGNLNTQDNNGDKSIGARVHGLYNNSIGLGLSFFTGNYNNQGSPTARITMLGADLQAYIAALAFRAGYAYMSVGLPLGTTRQTYTRGSLYTELSLKLTRSWKIAVRGGVQQNDNFVSDQNDRTVWGGKIEHLINRMMIVSFQYFRDFRNSPGKTNFDLAMLRYSITL